jgi:MerR family transcriptional regulator/heat shock protein HspR
MEIAIDELKPVYSINVVSELTNVSPRTLREYERVGFIKPARVNGNRRYSRNDLEVIQNISFYLNDCGLTLCGLALLYQMAPCWKIKNCETPSCPAYGEVRKKCWEAVAGCADCHAQICKGCPIYLIHATGHAVECFTSRPVGPRCYHPGK